MKRRFLIRGWLRFALFFGMLVVAGYLTPEEVQSHLFNRNRPGGTVGAVAYVIYMIFLVCLPLAILAYALVRSVIQTPNLKTFAARFSAGIRRLGKPQPNIAYLFVCGCILLFVASPRVAAGYTQYGDSVSLIVSRGAIAYWLYAVAFAVSVCAILGEIPMAIGGLLVRRTRTA